MVDIIYVLTLAFALPIVNAADSCNTHTLLGIFSEKYGYYVCCADDDHSGYEKCCDSFSNFDTDFIRHALAIGSIVGIVVCCVIVVGTIIGAIVCVCCMRNIHGRQGQTVTTVASGPYVMMTAGDRCNMYYSTLTEYCQYGCCTDYYHSGYEECYDSYSGTYSVAPIGPIIGIVVGCVILVGIVISIIVCCVCCMQKSRGQQGQTFTTAASGPNIMNQMSYGAQMGQAPYGQQQYPAQPPLQTGHMTPGTSVFNNSGMQGPPSYETVVDN